MKCYVALKHTNAKRWHNTLARHSKQFTLHSHLIVAANTRTHTRTYICRHIQTITCLLNLLLFVVDLFPSFLPQYGLYYHTTNTILYLLFRFTLYSSLFFFPFSPSHIYTWLEHRTHGNCIWISLISAFRFNLFFSSISFVVRYFYFTYNLFYECNRVCWNLWGWTSKITRFFVIFVLYWLEVLLLCRVSQTYKQFISMNFQIFFCLFSTSIFACPFPTKKNILQCVVRCLSASWSCAELGKGLNSDCPQFDKEA